MKKKHINFNEDIEFGGDLIYLTKFKEEEVEFLTFSKYNGPITMQYLPNGGIQSLIGNYVIVKVNNGFLKVEKLKFKDQILSSKEFIESVGEMNLINQCFE